MRNRIANGHDPLEPERAFVVAPQDPSPIRPSDVAVRVLDVVEARRVGLPDIDLAFLDGLAVRVEDAAGDEEGGAVGVVGEDGAVGHVVGVVGVEGAEDCAGRAVWGFGVRDGVYEQGEAEDVGEEDVFLYTCLMLWAWVESIAAHLPHVCTLLADSCQELEASHPFFEAETCFSCEVV